MTENDAALPLAANLPHSASRLPASLPACRRSPGTALLSCLPSASGEPVSSEEQGRLTWARGRSVPQRRSPSGLEPLPARSSQQIP